MRPLLLIWFAITLWAIPVNNLLGAAEIDSAFQRHTLRFVADTFANTHAKQPKLVNRFYEENRYAVSWFATAGDAAKRVSLKKIIQHAELYALASADYSMLFAQDDARLPTRADTFRLELLYTDAALSFMHDLAYGGDKAFVKFNGLQYHPDNIGLTTVLNKALISGNMVAAITSVEPNTERYNQLKTAYLGLLAVSSKENFQEISVVQKTIAGTNVELVTRLQQLQYLQNDTTKTALLNALRNLQLDHGLMVQPQINAYCLDFLNETLAHRLAELSWNITWHRWMNGMAGKKFVAVNVPSNMLYLYDSSKVRLKSKIVVGKLSTPTPTLTSEIRSVVYYPYWNVPHSIATGEMLPALKRNGGYANANRIQVLQNGTVVNPSAINWKNYSAVNFPFQLRQKTGCKNALGRLKFEFENPFHVYLHDTNFKGAFASAKRFLSHGCMRVEKPYELAIALGVPSQRINMSQCLENKKPEVIPLPRPVPVFVTYITVDVVDGRLVWYEDAYQRIRPFL